MGLESAGIGGIGVYCKHAYPCSLRTYERQKHTHASNGSCVYFVYPHQHISIGIACQNKHTEPAAWLVIGSLLEFAAISILFFW